MSNTISITGKVGHTQKEGRRAGRRLAEKKEFQKEMEGDETEENGVCENVL